MSNWHVVSRLLIFTLVILKQRSRLFELLFWCFHYFCSSWVRVSSLEYEFNDTVVLSLTRKLTVIVKYYRRMKSSLLCFTKRTTRDDVVVKRVLAAYAMSGSRLTGHVVSPCVMSIHLFSVSLWHSETDIRADPPKIRGYNDVSLCRCQMPWYILLRSIVSRGHMSFWKDVVASQGKENQELHERFIF